MRIMNVGAVEIEACCKFDYLGYEISASTIFNPPSVQITAPNGARHYFDTVEESIAWIRARRGLSSP